MSPDTAKLMAAAESLWNDPQLGKVAEIKRAIATKTVDGKSYQLQVVITMDFGDQMNIYKGDD